MFPFILSAGIWLLNPMPIIALIFLQISAEGVDCFISDINVCQEALLLSFMIFLALDLKILYLARFSSDGCL
uniref:Uncharacterized protein n=1 Tax=Panstrongylus lignarius TaxID=156445 RepID=A0A224Y4N1_9HEMI